MRGKRGAAPAHLLPLTSYLSRSIETTLHILLMGPPGAGKGTQGAILAQRLGLPKFATGDLLRDAVKRGTPLGQKAKAAQSEDYHTKMRRCIYLSTNMYFFKYYYS